MEGFNTIEAGSSSLLVVVGEKEVSLKVLTSKDGKKNVRASKNLVRQDGRCFKMDVLLGLTDVEMLKFYRTIKGVVIISRGEDLLPAGIRESGEDGAFQITFAHHAKIIRHVKGIFGSVCLGLASAIANEENKVFYHHLPS